MVLFLYLRIFDVGLTAAAAVATTVAVAHTEAIPLTVELLHTAAIAGAIKAAAMAHVGVFLSSPLASSVVVVLIIFLSSTFTTNLLVVWAICHRTLDYGM